MGNKDKIDICKRELEPLFDMLKEIYSCAEIDDKLFNQLINNGINNKIVEYNNQENTKDLSIFKESIIKQFHDYINKQLSSSDLKFRILNNLVNEKISKNKNGIQILSEISEFLKVIEFTPEPNDLCKLLDKNPYFEHVIAIIVDSIVDKLNNNNISDIFDDDFQINCIELYCEKNNINYINDIDLDIKKIDKANITSSFLVYLHDIKKYPLLDKDKEMQLFNSYHTGNLSSKNKLIEGNLRLVVSIAYKYRSSTVDILDIIQEGNLGLMKAVEKYNINMGYKFSTYATYWIKQFILRYIKEKSRNIKIPNYLYGVVQKYNSLCLYQSCLTPQEISKKLNISEEVAKSLELVTNDTISLNTFKYTEADEKELINFVEDETINIEDTIDEQSLSEEIIILLNEAKLSEREKFVIKARFGFNSQHTVFSRAEVGKYFKVSYESIRNNELRALRKIRNAKKAKALAVYMSNPEKALLFLKDHKGNINHHHSKKDKYAKKMDKKEEKSNSINENNVLSIEKIYCDKLYLYILSQLKDIAFTRFSHIFTDEEKELISVQYGYIDGHCLSIDATAHILNISKQEVILIMQKILTKYKDYLYKMNEDNDEEKNQVEQLILKINNSFQNN